MPTIAIDKIQIGSRVRKAHPEDVKLLAQSIASEGLLQPIILRDIGKGRARLVVGLHRLEAHKLLGKSTIEYVWMQTTGDTERDNLTEDIIECAENLQRAGLDDGMRALFVNKQTIATAKRITLDRATEAEKAKAEADAKVKAAKGDAEKQEARKVQRAAIGRVDTASKAKEDLFRVFSSGGEDSLNKMPNGVVEIVAKEAGVKSKTISHDLGLVRTHGAEVLELASHIQLKSNDGNLTKASTRSELAALAKLKTEYPKDHARVVESWRRAVEGKGHPLRPSTVLAELGMRAAEDKRHERSTTVLGALERLIEGCSKAKTELQEARSASNMLATALSLKQLPNDLRRAFETIEQARSLAVRHRNALNKEAAQ